MARKIISFDCDGVITPGAFVPPEFRTNKHYCQIVPIEDAVPSLQWLSTMYDIYIISTRSHTDSNLGLRAWLHWVLGLEMDTLAGVITGPSGGAREASLEVEGRHMDKPRIVSALECVVHFDDRPDVVEAMPGVGVLFPSDLPGSQEARNIVPTVEGWAGVREFLTTPSMTLYGSDGAEITSPATAFVPDPARGLVQ